MLQTASALLDVIIGVVFVFLLTSLVCSSVGDQISEWLRWRAKGLEEGLRNYVTGDQDLLAGLYANPLIDSLVPEEPWITKTLSKLPLIGGTISHRKEMPVNIPAKTFTLALFDLFIPNAMGETTVSQLRASVATLPPNSPLRAPLLSIVSTAENNITTVRANIENWYDTTMQKTTKLYQGHMWRFALVLGALVSMFLNIDTISIGKNLWNDAALRSMLVAEANKYTQGTPEKDKALDQLNSLGLPIGWQVTVTNPTADPITRLFSLRFAPTDWLAKPNQPAIQVNGGALFFKAFGWLISALAVAQGAPFWFDFLRKLTSIPKS